MYLTHVDAVIDESDSVIASLYPNPKKYMLIGTTMPAPPNPPQFVRKRKIKTNRRPTHSIGSSGKRSLCKHIISVEQYSKGA